MRHCPKCDRRFDDASKICRSCGAILDEIVDEPASATSAPAASVVDVGPPVEEPEVEASDATSPDANWLCPKCGELVPASFHICWNCESERLMAASRAAAAQPTAEPVSSLAAGTPRCSSCGSTKIIPAATVVDSGESSSGTLRVVIYGKPDAIIFKDRLYGALVADICSNCGRVELRLRNCGEMYEHYLRSLE